MKMLQRLVLSFAAVLVLTGISTAQESKPVFEQTADVSQQIDAALVKSRKENRRVLILWGKNDSEQSIAFNKSIVGDRNIGKTLRYEYDVIRVEAYGSNKNQESLKRYQVKQTATSLPYLTVLDADGKTLAGAEGASFIVENAGSKEVNNEAVLEFLTKHQAKAIDAGKVLEQAMARAKAEKKFVFLHFGAPWCGWCHVMEAWMDEPQITAALSKVFVDLKVDTDRMTGGAELLKKYCEKEGGIPWFALLSPEDGSVVATSDAPEGNIGFPSTDGEIEHFLSMLQSTKKFSNEETTSLRESLVENRNARESKSRKKAP